jgi:hypothetical protein
MRRMVGLCPVATRFVWLELFVGLIFVCAPGYAGAQNTESASQVKRVALDWAAGA